MRMRFRKHGRSRISSTTLPMMGPDGNPAILYSDAEGKLSVGTQTTICDFCSAPNPNWILPVGHVKIDGNPIMSYSDDDWMTCDACKPLVETRDVEALVDRSLSEALRKVALLGIEIVPQEDALKKDARANYTRVLAAVRGPIHKRVQG